MRTSECAWSQTELAILGTKLVGLRGFEFEKNIDKEYMYASGSEPIDIQTGNKSYPGSIKVLKYELDKMNDAALAAGYEDITEVPHEAITITCTFKKTAADKTRKITATGVAFTNNKIGMEQGAKMTEVTLPFLSMKTTII